MGPSSSVSWQGNTPVPPFQKMELRQNFSVRNEQFILRLICKCQLTYQRYVYSRLVSYFSFFSVQWTTEQLASLQFGKRILMIEVYRTPIRNQDQNVSPALRSYWSEIRQTKTSNTTLIGLCREKGGKQPIIWPLIGWGEELVWHFVQGSDFILCCFPATFRIFHEVFSYINNTISTI